MRRDDGVAVDATDVPAWVMEAGDFRAAVARLNADVALMRAAVVASAAERAAGNEFSTPQHHERRRNRAAAETWCAARGLSFARVVFGSRWPTEPETLAGTTRGAGPKWAAMVEFCRSNGMGVPL